ncbi:MAG: hypothetical protein VW390_03005, partial [Gammaproteobacteria bacterium]
GGIENREVRSREVECLFGNFNRGIACRQTLSPPFRQSSVTHPFDGGEYGASGATRVFESVTSLVDQVTGSRPLVGREVVGKW